MNVRVEEREPHVYAFSWVEVIWCDGFVNIKVMRFFLHFIHTEVEGIKCIAFILVQLWNIVQLSLLQQIAFTIAYLPAHRCCPTPFPSSVRLWCWCRRRIPRHLAQRQHPPRHNTMRRTHIRNCQDRNSAGCIVLRVNTVML